MYVLFACDPTLSIGNEKGVQRNVVNGMKVRRRKGCKGKSTHEMQQLNLRDRNTWARLSEQWC